MAFPFGSSTPASGMHGGNVQVGEELKEVETEDVGFLAINGDAKVKLLPTPWPTDSLPPPTSSLLSIASTKCLIAAAGPEGIVIARTDSVRKAFNAEAARGNVRPFQPELQIPLPARVSHLAFSADENALVVAVEGGDGLAAFDVAGLLQGKTQPAATISTNGATLRALVPNPEMSELFAAVTSNGDLLVANFKSNQLVSGPNGPVLKSGASCISWSNRGKQLVAGLADGSAFQLTPEGQGKAEIPRVPDIGSDHHVSSISWLENNVFIIVCTPSAASDDSQPVSSYYVVTREPPDKYQFRLLPEVCSPFGLERYPAYQFIARLRDVEPGLKDVLIISSTASTDIGLYIKSTKSLNPEKMSTDASPVFASAIMSEDSRRAVLPMTDDYADTSTIGMCLDLSGKDKVLFPIPGEDIAESPYPLPAFSVLTNDGMLSSWWFVYSDAIKQRKAYRGLAIMRESQASQQQVAPTMPAAPAQPPAQPSQPSQPAFGQSSFGQPAFGKPSTPAFGTTSPLGANNKPSFGSPSALGGTPQAPAPSTGGPAVGFGSPSPLGGTGEVSFGTPGALGRRGPGFGQPSALGGGKSPFGQPPATSSGSGFANIGAGGGGFSSFASGAGGGFASVAKPAGESPFAKSSGESPFAKASGDNAFANAGQPVFGTPAAKTSPFEPATTTTPTAPMQQEKPSAGFGFSSGDFKLGSTFKPDANAAMDEDKPAQQQNKGLSLGAAFGDSLGLNTEAAKPAQPIVSAAPTFAAPTSIFSSDKEQPSTTPSTTKFSGLFGAPSPQTNLQQATSASTTSIFGQPSLPSTSGSTTTPTSIFGQPSLPLTSKKSPTPTAPSLLSEPSLSDSTVKVEMPSEIKSPPPREVSEPPLPPESTSKQSYAPGDTSASSSGVSGASYDEAPLPPDFLQPKKPEAPQEVGVTLPGESAAEKEEFEDSGEDVANEVSSADEADENRVQSLKVSPESSFGVGLPDGKSPTGGLFTKVTAPEKGAAPPPPKQLFGEITTAKPLFPTPKIPEPRLRLSPRSPSPVRRQYGHEALARADGIRVASAPDAPLGALTRRKATLESSLLARSQKSFLPDELEDVAEAQQKAREAEREAAESYTLDEDDEDEQLRADLARPISPSPTLDPFLPHQDYTGESLKPGIPGQVELLYRDINTMIDTLGINARSLSAFLLYQDSAKETDYTRWTRMLQQTDRSSDVLNERLLLSEMDKLLKGVDVLDATLQRDKVEGIQDKSEKCREIISRDLSTLRGQCANVQRTLDAHTDAITIESAPLSAEQSILQQGLRKLATETRSKLADLEREVSVFRARIADASKLSGGGGGEEGDRRTARPTVEAVASTISTMTNMAEKKSGDIDVLEAQMKRMGLDVTGSPAPGRSSSRDASSFVTTPAKKVMGARLPATPGSRGSQDGQGHWNRSQYQTPESGSAHRFRLSLQGRGSSYEVSDMVTVEELERWKAKTARRNEIVGHLRSALGNRRKTTGLRTVDV